MHEVWDWEGGGGVAWVRGLVCDDRGGRVVLLDRIQRDRHGSDVWEWQLFAPKGRGGLRLRAFGRCGASVSFWVRLSQLGGRTVPLLPVFPHFCCGGCGACHETTARAARLEQGFPVTLIRLVSNASVFREYQRDNPEGSATPLRMKGRKGYVRVEACWEGFGV